MEVALPPGAEFNVKPLLVVDLNVSSVICPNVAVVTAGTNVFKSFISLVQLPEDEVTVTK